MRVSWYTREMWDSSLPTNAGSITVVGVLLLFLTPILLTSGLTGHGTSTLKEFVSTADAVHPRCDDHFDSISHRGQ